MLEELMQLIQQHGQEAVTQNSAVPDEHNEAVMQEAQSAITNGLQQLATSGQLNQVAQAVQNGQAVDQSHPAVQEIAGNFINNITQKFGINSAAASSIAASLIPSVMGKILGGQQSQQSGSGFNLGGLLSSLTGGKL